MEAVIQSQNKVPLPASDTARAGSISSHNTRLTRTLAPQLGSVRSDVDAPTSAWNEAQQVQPLNMETPLFEDPPTMSFAPGKAMPSYQNLPLSTSQDSAETGQKSAQNVSDGHLGSKEDADAANVDKEATIIAPQVVNWEHHAYFEDSFDSTLGIVYKPEFESALRAHFRGELMSGDDAAWFALRKTVYASGCRVYLSKNTSVSFAEIQAEAWSYFQSAMSVLVELLFAPTGLLAVRALAAMTFFAEGLGNPALEYMFCANAARVAQAKGLHRRPSKAWNLAAHDELHYSWLFWAIYCCEKHIAHRSGRPSAIDDDEISCQIPSEACPGSTLDVETFTYLIRHAQISSQISKQLMSVKAFQQPPTTLLETVAQLDHQLHEWRDSLPTELRPDDRLRSFQVPRGPGYLPTVLMHCAYYGSLMAIHTIFAYPWIYSTIFGNGRGVVTQDQVFFSSNTVAEAARNIIIIARSLEINGASIQWSTFYYPMIGIINLFIHVLKFPSLSSARSDVALLDVATGYFGHMEFITSSELSFPFARDVATVARQTVNKAASRTDVPASTSADDGVSPANDVDTPFGEIFCASQDFNLDDWSVFSSVFSDDALMNRETGF